MIRKLLTLTCISGVCLMALLLLLATQSAAATPTTPQSTLLVTSNSNNTITTCAGAPNDCSLRGAVQLANGSLVGASIYFSPTITSISLSSPITLTHNLIYIYGNGSEVTHIKTSGNFPALVVTSDYNLISGLWISANGSHAGTNQHGLLVSGTYSTISSTSLSDLGGDGLLLQGGGHNTISGNYIGVQTSNHTPIANCTYQNDQWGIYIANSPNNDIAGNTIGCSGGDGIGLTGAGTADNQLRSNYIGIVSSGGRVTNTLSGVAVLSGAHDNLIGIPNGGNHISANSDGVFISGTGTNSNIVQLNSIGVISNSWDGLSIQAGAQFNKVLTNTIMLNGGSGIYLTGASTAFNLIYANTLLANHYSGITIDNGASYTSIGQLGNRSAGNWISGNGDDGIYINGATTRYNHIDGNLIGTDQTGNAAIPNQDTGITLDNTNNNDIGRLDTERNVIAGNRGDGILLTNGAHDNPIHYNDIGLNRDFQVAASSNTPNQPAGGGTSFVQIPNGGGITIYNSYTNTIGGPLGSEAASNLIFYNYHTGIYVAGGSQANIIAANTIRANHNYGILFDGSGTEYNTITRTLIISNGLDGIGERNSAGLNAWSEVGINANGGLGIDKNASDDALNTVDGPYLFFDSIDRTLGAVRGHAHATGLGTVKVELYRVAPDPSGFGEGWSFVGRAVTNSSGNWAISDPSPTLSGGCYTALVTEVQFGVSISSEFSANTCRVFLPITVKH